MKKIKKFPIAVAGSLILLSTTVFATTGKVYNTSKGLVLRGEASKTGAPLATVADGADVEILENLGEWYKVKADGKEGYLFAEYVKVTEETPAETTTEEPTDTSSDTPTDTTPETPEREPENTTPETKVNKTIKAEAKMYIMPIITSSTMGTIPAETTVTVEKTAGNWNYISYNNVKGWVRVSKFDNAVVEENKPTEEQEPETPTTPTTPTEETPATTPAENTNLSFTKGYINVSSANIRKGPSKTDSIVTTLILNTGVTITAQTDEWYKITYGDYVGYIFKELVSEKPTATSRSSELRGQNETAEKEESTETTAPVTNTSTSSEGEKIVNFAKQYLGCAYVYGGTTPKGGFDCSGFIYYVFNSCGYSISRSCSVQAKTGTAVSKSELQPGDIVFFNNTSNGAIGHVGIYIGEGRFIHAANTRRGVVTDTLNSGYYNTYYYSARRVF